MASIRVLLCLFLGASATGVCWADMRPFTVADAVEMTRLLDPDVLTATVYGVEPEVKFSPDGRHFVIVTRRGDLDSGQNEYELQLYDSAEVLDFLSKEAAEPLPRGRVLLRLSSSTNDHAIQALRWLPDSQSLAFINRVEDSPGQVYRIDIQSPQLQKLTEHAQPVDWFEINTASGNILYRSTIEVDDSEWQDPSYVVQTRNILDVAYPKRRAEFSPVVRQQQYYLVSADNRTSIRVVGEPFGGAPTDVWISPDGRRAVTKRMVENVPAEWTTEYRPFANHEYYRSMLELFDENTMAPAWYLTQFVLIDLESGSVTPLVDAPADSFSSGYINEVEWLGNGDSVILANTFLPLNVQDAAERDRRSRAAATVEVDVRTGRIIRIADYPTADGAYQAGEVFTGMSLGDDGALTIKLRTGGRQHGKAAPPKIYRKRKGGWEEVRAADEANNTGNALARRLAVFVRQSLKTPPDLVARDLNTGRDKVITDLNPQFRQLTLGKVERFEWTDAQGLEWVSGLLYPPDFRDGTRYPLVIQTHGFHDEFLIDGPVGMSSAYAAQGLANRGIVVLQMPDRAVGDSEEREVHRRGVEAAVDKLDAMGLIDRKRVGAIGFSGSGHVVQHLITFSDYDFAAATVADAFSMSFMGYVSSFGWSAPGILYFERLNGSVPWGDGLNAWISNDPAFNLDRVKTPLRLEMYRSGISPYWDIYTILRRQQKPVEFHVFPHGVHNIVQPLQYYSSGQGNVDWFDFWLNDRERTEPYPGTPETKESLEEQYKRWRRLKKQQVASEAAAIKARQWHKEEAARWAAAEAWLETEEGKKATATLLETANDVEASFRDTGTDN